MEVVDLVEGSDLKVVCLAEVRTIVWEKLFRCNQVMVAARRVGLQVFVLEVVV